MFANIITSATVYCYGYGGTPAQTFTADGTTRFITCTWNFSDLGVTDGNIYNFDIHTVPNGDGTGTVYQGIGCPNCAPLMSAGVNTVGMTGVSVVTETTSQQANMGDYMNFNMVDNSWFQRAYYYSNGWIEFPSPSSSTFIQSPSIQISTNTSGVGNDIYCDRPLGSEPYSNGTYYQSGFLDSTYVRNSCI